MRRRTVKLLVILALDPACGPTIAVADNDDTTGSTSDDSGSTAAPSTSGSQASTTDATSDASTDDPATTALAESSTGLPYDIVELRLDPVFAILDSATGGQTRDFHAIAVTDTGDEIDVTDAVTWSLDGPGTLEVGVLTTPASDVPVFDRATISATLDGIDAVAHAAVSVRTSGPNTPQLFNLSHPPEPRQLDYRPLIEKLDVFFLVDTVSWADEDFLIPFHDRVMNVIVPQLQAEGLDVQFGSGRFSAFPLEGSGQDSCGNGQGDQPFELWSEISPDIDELAAGLAPAAAGAPIGCLYDRGSVGEALYQIATGVGLDGPGATYVEPNAGVRGGVGFREDSLAVIHSTTFDILLSGLDLLAPMQGEALSVAHTPQQVVEALQARQILHIGQTEQSISSNGVGSFHAFAELAVETGGIVPQTGWNHPDLGRPADCTLDECCVDDSDGYVSEISDFCPLSSTYDLQAGAFNNPDDNIARDFYALTHYLLTDVSTSLIGEDTSVSGIQLPAGTTTDTFITLTALEADDPPEPDMPAVILDEGTFRLVSPGTNLNYEVTLDAAAVPAMAGEPLLYRVGVSLRTGYRAGSVVQEYWIVSPPLDTE